MCRQLILTNELYLGSRQLGFEVFSLPKGEILEFTSKQLKDIIRQGKDEVYGLTLSETNELVPDTEKFFCNNWMVKTHVNALKPKFECDSMINVFYIVIGTHKEKDGVVYDALSSRYERTCFAAEKLRTLLEMGIICAGAKLLENGEIIVAPLERQEITKEPVKEGKAANRKGTKEPEKALKTGKAADSKNTKEPEKAEKATEK